MSNYVAGGVWEDAFDEQGPRRFGLGTNGTEHDCAALIASSR